MRDGLYMLAIMPPKELEVKIDNERKLFREKYGFIKGLKPPVHITLYEPFKALPEIETEFSSLREITDRQTPFQLTIKGYDFFSPNAKPYYIWHWQRARSCKICSRKLSIM